MLKELVYYCLPPVGGAIDPDRFIRARALSFSFSICSTVLHVTIVRCEPVGFSLLQIFLGLDVSATCSLLSRVELLLVPTATLVVVHALTISVQKIRRSLTNCIS